MTKQDELAALLRGCNLAGIPPARSHPCPTFWKGYHLCAGAHEVGAPYLLFKEYDTAKAALMACNAVAAPHGRAWLAPHGFGYVVEIIPEDKPARVP